MSSMEQILHTFNLYMVQGAPTATALSNKNYAKLCKDCKIVDGIKLTNADIDVMFSKYKTHGQQTITFDQFILIMRELGAKRFGIARADDIFELIKGRKPLSAGSTRTSAASVVERLTDTSKYTGMHKERFDTSGRGRGIEGRSERVTDYSGYVSGYKNQGSYDKQH